MEQGISSSQVRAIPGNIDRNTSFNPRHQVPASAPVGQPDVVLFQSQEDPTERSRQQPSKARDISQQDLVKLLARLQQQIAERTRGIRNTRPIQLHTAIGSFSDAAGKDLINLTAMLFDFILADFHSAPRVRAEISYLQIPYLKLLIEERELLAQPSHPARKLLSDLARTAISWDYLPEDKQQRFQREIHQIVRQILEAADTDLALFQNLQRHYAEFMAMESLKSRILDPDAEDEESRQVRAQQAQEIIERTLQGKLETWQLPHSTVELIQQGWSRVMFLAYLREDNEKSWKHSLQVLDELIWCQQHHTTFRDRQRWVKTVPQLLKTLKKELRESGYNSGKLEQQLLALKRELTQTFKRQSVFSAIQEIPPPSRPGNALSHTKTAIERQEEQEKATLAEYLARVDQLEAGTWLEFNRVDGTSLRCRLATLGSDDEPFVFINRLGFKVLRKSRYELASDFRRNRVRVDTEAEQASRKGLFLLPQWRRTGS